jgi:hypothetical protein
MSSDFCKFLQIIFIFFLQVSLGLPLPPLDLNLWLPPGGVTTMYVKY